MLAKAVFCTKIRKSVLFSDQAIKGRDVTFGIMVSEGRLVLLNFVEAMTMIALL